MQAEAAKVLSDRDAEHQRELRDLDKEKTKREMETIQKERDMQAKHEDEIRKLNEEAAARLKRS